MENNSTLKDLQQKRTAAEEIYKDLLALRIKCRRNPEKILVTGAGGAYFLKYEDILPIVETELAYTKSQLEMYEQQAVEAYARKFIHNK